MFAYGTVGANTICSKHGTLLAAVRAARACERRGGALHKILKVQEVG